MNNADFAAEVRDFYERLPYPAPVTDLNGYGERWEQGDRRRAAFHLLWPAEQYRDDLEVLVAGCGTSQAAKHAMREPAAQITAIDVSESSLQHTRQLQNKHKIDNLELHRLQLEQVEKLGRRFDKIVCTGVLHHLPDPDAGLRALRAVLKPGGAMHLMVYATYGRTGIYMLQEYCRLLGVRAQDRELADLATTLGELPHGHPITYLLNQAKDFRTPPALADALLHPQDRAYTVPQLYDWLEHCGCSFGRWTLQAPYLPHCGVVARSPHATRLKELPAIRQYASLELLRGTMVKHEFVAYGDATHFEFGAEKYLDYVPIRNIAAITVKERLPAGAVAVLLNPMHTHTDIYLPIDAAEESLLTAIDGRRSIKDIVQKGNKGSAREFFRRLWQYDQIVFDASG